MLKFTWDDPLRFAAQLTAEFGCAGMNYVSYGLIARAIERVDSGAIARC